MSKKVMLITGASSGIGRATALSAADKGYKLILTARSEDKLNKLVEEVGRDQALAAPADVTVYKQLKSAIDSGVEHFGGLDVVFANAGTGLSQPGTENGEPEEWDQLIDVNVKGLLWTAKLTLEKLKPRKGHFIITSSVAGRIPLKGSIYGASKWFAYGFGLNLAEEMKEWGGRCTTICPGMVNTPFFDEAKPDKLDAQDVADAVIFATEAPQRSSIREVMLMPTH